MRRNSWKRPRSVSLGITTKERRLRTKAWADMKTSMLPLLALTSNNNNSDDNKLTKGNNNNNSRHTNSHLWIGEYTIIAPLHNGGGGGAYLFQAKSRVTGETVVIKMVDKESAAKKETARKALKQLRKEALVMACLQEVAQMEGEKEEEEEEESGSESDIFENENEKQKEKEAPRKEKEGLRRIVPLLEVIEDSKRFCIVLPFVEGGDLFEYITSQGALQKEEAWRVFDQIVEGLSYAHSNGFIHRDIKPENIFLDAEGNVFIGDWGFATHWSALTPKRRCCGSPNYVAGELLREAPYIGPEVDVFSLGVVFYACLTGNLPFGSSKRPDYRKKVKQGLWIDHPCLSSAERDLLDAMFHPNPLLRATLYDITMYLKHWRN